MPTHVHLSARAFATALNNSVGRKPARGWFVKVWSFGDRLTIIWDTRRPPKNMHPLDSKRSKGDIFGTGDGGS